MFIRIIQSTILSLKIPIVVQNFSLFLLLFYQNRMPMTHKIILFIFLFYRKGALEISDWFLRKRWIFNLINS